MYSKQKRTNRIAFLVVSITIITLLHYFTTASRWDMHDFLRRFYYIPIIVAAFSFRIKGGLITSTIISCLYAPHLLLPYVRVMGDGKLTILNQIMEIIMFIVVGGVTGVLAESDYKKKNKLELQIKKLTDLENYTQNILDSITNTLIAVDRNLRIKTINKYGREFFKSGEPIVGKNLSGIFRNSEELHSILNNVLSKERKVNSQELKLYIRNDKKVIVKLTAYPLYNIIKEVEGVVIVLEDISKIRELEYRIRRAEKLSAVGELASGIAHEIRNPLGIIKTIAQTISKDIKDEDHKEGIDIILEEINRANNVIKGILDFAKPNIHKKIYVDINILIDEILLITKKYTQQHSVEVNFYSYTEDVDVFVDIDKIKQAFINIIFNSVQAMPKGGCLNIRVSDIENYIVISFSDSGIGIKQEIIEKIFEPFYTTKDIGTGLGLAITHRIIEDHKGYIEVYSEENKGTNIEIYLPIYEKGSRNE